MEVEEVEEEVEVEMGSKMSEARWGSWANIPAVGEEEVNMESMETGEEETFVTHQLQFLQTTPDPGDFLDPPATPTLHQVQRSSCLRSRGSGLQVPSIGLKISRGKAVLWPNEEAKEDVESLLLQASCKLQAASNTEASKAEATHKQASKAE